MERDTYYGDSTLDEIKAELREIVGKDPNLETVQERSSPYDDGDAGIAEVRRQREMQDLEIAVEELSDEDAETYFDEYDGYAGGLRRDRDIARGIDQGNPTEYIRDKLEDEITSDTYNNLAEAEEEGTGKPPRLDEQWPEVEDGIKRGASRAEEEENSSASRATQHDEGSTTVNGRKVDRSGFIKWLETVPANYKWAISRNVARRCIQTSVSVYRGRTTVTVSGFRSRYSNSMSARDNLFYNYIQQSSRPYGTIGTENASAGLETLSSVSSPSTGGSNDYPTARKSDSISGYTYWISTQVLINLMFYYPEGYYSPSTDLVPFSKKKTLYDGNGKYIGSTSTVRTYSGTQSPVIIGFDPNLNEVNLPSNILKKDDSMDNACCQMISKIYEVINPDQYPGKMPISLLIEDPKDIEIKTLTDLLLHKFYLWDEVIGQWPVKIRIPDADRTKEGEQQLDISFPNLAEMLAEIYGLTMNQSIDNDLYEKYLATIIAETGLTRIASRQSYDALREILDWMGVDWQKENVDMQMTFTPGEAEAEKVLQPCVRPYQSPKISDKEQNLKQVFQQLLHAAAIIRATHFRPVDRKGDVKGQILDNLKKGIDLYNRLDKVQAKDNQTWDQFKKSVEDNFKAVTGDTNVTDNPLIKDVEAKPPNS